MDIFKMYYRPNIIPQNNNTELDGTTSPYGLWRYGNDYHNASVTLLINHDESAFTPFFSTAAQSIELSLKAFLTAKGFDVDELRREFGHDLNKLFSKAREEDINNIMNTDLECFTSIDLLNVEYKRKRYHYIKTGTMFLPRTDWIVNTSYEFTRELERFCFENTKWK
jgi:HEPN domain-containing protein